MEHWLWKTKIWDTLVFVICLGSHLFVNPFIRNVKTFHEHRKISQVLWPFFNTMNERVNSSAIRQREESQNGCYRKTKHAKFFEFTPDTRSQNFSTWYVSVSGGKKCLIFGKFGLLCFLVTPVLRFFCCL